MCNKLERDGRKSYFFECGADTALGRKADAAVDARRAVESGDFRVYIPAGRGDSIPGISADENARIRQDCGEKILPGSTDVVRGDRHLQLLQAAHHYAKTYNAIVAELCSKR